MRTCFVIPIAALALTLAVGARAAEPMNCEGAPTATKLTLVIEGVKSDRGLMAVTLYGNDQARFLVKGGAIKVWRDPASPPSQTMCIWLPAPGYYAVAVYHDANANHKLDLGTFGPTEAYGFSRNPRILFSKPRLSAVRFDASGADTTLHIKLHYP